MDEYREPAHPDRVKRRHDLCLSYNWTGGNASLDPKAVPGWIMMIDDLMERVLALEARR